MHLPFCAFLSLALAAVTHAEDKFLADVLSFGHAPRIPSNGDTIPNFRLVGDPNAPEVLSNKVILTPPAPGNQRGAVWAERQLEHTAWTADIEFRATGPDRGGGKLQIWLVKKSISIPDPGTSSIYTVGKFEGLALSIDTYAGTAGVVRGFLNDGQVSYKDHHSVDSLAFGHCAYAYRNLGRPSLLSIRHDDNEFKVTVDGNTCFASPNVRIPAGYFFGISAVSAELPDSFEIFKLVVTTDTHDPLITRNDPISQGTPAEQMANAPGSSSNANVALPDDPADTSAETLVTQTQQFADLHNRLQAIFKHISTFQRDFTQYQRTSAERYTRMESNAGLPTERLNQLEERLIRIEKSIDQVKAVTGDRDYLRLHNDLLRTVKDSHSTLLENVTGVASSIPSVTIVVLLVLAFQGLLAGAYFVYKKRSMNTPKKYL